jgi:N-acyl-D-amino-acid deacylase
LPAKKFNMQRRGELKVGNFADVAIIDLSSYRDTATFENADTYAQGVQYVLVNGVLSFVEGRVLSGCAGKVLYR